MVARVVLSLCLACLAGLNSRPQTRPDFSGRWTFDRSRSAEPWNGRIVIAPILGDECVATQDGTALKLSIKVGGQTVSAVYNFAGESRNLSPGDIPVTSRTSWDGDKLVIVSTSAATAQGQAITIETRRILHLDAGGRLIIERTGTPASEVTPSRSVYTRAR
jgi:hypothetical protein